MRHEKFFLAEGAIYTIIGILSQRIAPLILTLASDVAYARSQAITDPPLGKLPSSSRRSADDQTGASVAPAAQVTGVATKGVDPKLSRAAENAVLQAEDAFGTSIGRETIGIYSAGSVRGFSPVSAGNTRIESLFIDQVQSPNARIRRSTTIRVGLSAFGFPFPAPTGIVDYKLRSPGNKATTSAYLAFDSWGGGALEVDVARPIGKALSLGLGAALYNNEFGDGTDTIQNVQALSLRWTPSSRLEVQPFWQRSFVSDDVGPIYSPAGPYLPPRLPRRRFAGPTWADHEGTSILYGFHGKVALGPRTILRAGLFRSLLEDRTGAANLYTGLMRDGQARHIVLIDPPGSFGSDSGEVRLTQSFSRGRWVHLVHASLRGRDRQRIYGGSAQVDLGLTDILRVIRVPRPMLRFSTQSEDRVRQLTAGIAYEGQWKGVGELSLGLQRTSYRKRVRLPDLAAAVTSSDPWLLNATLALHASNSVAVYVGYVSGLEESGIAPANALNRNEPLSAIKTSQRDAGLRWTIRPGLRFVVGAFDIRKPYFQLDESKIFSLLGDVRNRGLEFSLSGKISPRLVMIAGAVLSKPVVDGKGIRLDRIGPRPVGLASSTFRLNGDWRPTIAEKLSLDFGIGYTSRRPSTRDNSVFVPSRTIIDIGARYKIREGNDPLTLRLAAVNVFDSYAPEVLSSGSYYANPGRVVTLSLASDF